MRAYADQVKDRNRKLGTLENKVKDLEDEQILLIEQHKDQLQSSQALMQHKIDDSKRRQLELEEMLKESKQLVSQLQDVPTQDRPSQSAQRSDQAHAEEVLQLHEQLTEMQSKMLAMEEANMESVALLKQENRKLAKQLKEAPTAKGPLCQRLAGPDEHAGHGCPLHSERGTAGPSGRP